MIENGKGIKRSDELNREAEGQTPEGDGRGGREDKELLRWLPEAFEESDRSQSQGEALSQTEGIFSSRKDQNYGK